MNGVNRQTLIGHLGSDVELKTLPSGDPVVNVSIAVTDTWKDKGGEEQKNTNWFKLAIFKKPAEIWEKHAFKGQKVFVEGPTRNRSYDNADGDKVYVSEVLVRDFQFLTWKDDAVTAQVGESQPAFGGATAPESTGNDSLPF